MGTEGSFRTQVERGVERRMRRIWRVAGFVLFLFIFPVIVLYSGLVPFSWRLWMLASFAALVGVISFRGERSLRSLGIRSDNVARAWVPYLLFTLAGVCALFLYALVLGKAPLPGWGQSSHLLFLFIPISFSQEFLYRGFLMPELRRLYVSIVSVVLIDALLFMLLHIIYGEPLITLPLALAGGIAFSYMYYKYPNLLLVALSHSALNFVAVLYGLF